MKEWERQQKLRYDEIHPEYLGLVMTDKNRWEYQKVVDRQSVERAISLSPSRKQKQTALNFNTDFYGQKTDSDNDTGIIRQFNELKKKHPDAIFAVQTEQFL